MSKPNLYNHEGYFDPTAFEALSNIEEEAKASVDIPLQDGRVQVFGRIERVAKPPRLRERQFRQRIELQVPARYIGECE